MIQISWRTQKGSLFRSFTLSVTIKRLEFYRKRAKIRAARKRPV